MGNYIIILKRGMILPATRIDMGAKEKGGAKATVKVTSNNLVLEFPADQLEKIHTVQPKNSFADLAKEFPEGNTALANLFCGIIEIENLAREFRNTGKATPEDKSLPIAIFGSASLALSIIPNRASHDVDAAVTRNFLQFCIGRQREDEEQKKKGKDPGKNLGAIPQICHWALFRYLGEWTERACRLTGLEKTEFLIVHPLDTVLQKLLRIPGEKFEEKDKQDIRDTMRILHPSKATMTDLLIENPTRYRLPEDSALKIPFERNTRWFLKTFLPEHTFESITKLASQKEQEELFASGLASDPHLPKPNPKRVKDILHEI